MTDDSPWDAQYSKKGELWHGGAGDLPELPAGSRVLELGCGNGKTLIAMTGRGWDVTAVDISPSAVELARKALERAGGGGTVSVGDVRDLEFPDGSFNAVFAIHVLGHLDEDGRRAAAVEIERVLSDGGQVFFRDFHKGDMRYGMGREVAPGTFVRKTGISTHFFAEEETEGLFYDLEMERTGLQRWEQRTRDGVRGRCEVVAVFRKIGVQ